MQQQSRGWQVITIITALAIVVTLGIAHAVTQLTTPAKNASSTTAIVSTMPTTIPAPTATPRPLLPGLSVQGTRFVDANGHTVTLIGASRQSLEYLCHGDGHFLPADFAAMRAWGMNAVRIPLTSEFWANAGGTCPDYRQTVTQAVFNAESAGLYVILDLQWDAPFDTAYDQTHGGVQCPLPDTQKDVAFWQDLASIYQNDHAVIFDLFSEPHDVSWEQWLNGGTISTGCYIINGAAAPMENATYQAIGMLDLVAKVRAIAPANIMILSGLAWGYDLSGITPIAGTNLVYGTHPFNYATKSPDDWPHDFGALATKLPVIGTEFGSYDCGTSYTSAAISYFTQHHMSWLAWAWNVGDCGGPSLLADWSGTPSQPYGTFIRQQMLAAAGNR